MGNEESIKDLKYFRENEYGLSDSTIDLSIRALEKQIPKQVSEMELVYKNNSDGYCPNCSIYITSAFKYCPNCGQKLDWD